MTYGSVAKHRRTGPVSFQGAKMATWKILQPPPPQKKKKKKKKKKNIYNNNNHNNNK